MFCLVIILPLQFQRLFYRPIEGLRHQILEFLTRILFLVVHPSQKFQYAERPDEIVALFMVEQMIALPFLLDPRPFADDEIGRNLAFLIVGDFVFDVPVDVGGPGHLLINFAWEVGPLEGVDVEAVSELG
jgi:hypothetical protein